MCDIFRVRGLNYALILIKEESNIDESFKLDFANDFWISSSLIWLFLGLVIFTSILMPILMRIH